MNNNELNPEQKKAVETTEGRLLILAGAGSGKTKVIVHRIAHLISRGVPPSSILGLTFTNKAAGEMRERVAALLGKNQAKEVWLSTFHSFCMKVLRKEIHRLGYTNHFSLYDEKDVRRLLNQLARERLKIEGDLPSMESIFSKISEAKNRGDSSIEQPKSNAKWHETFSRQLFEELQVCMRAYNAVDFDTLLSLTLDLFQKHPEILEKYQEQYRYIMIDEYQDTNLVQFRLAQLLSAKHQNLCVVGDDDQSIYGWRGAEIKNILNFEATHTIKLERNYRSTSAILKAANHLIENNRNRHKKTLISNQSQSEPIILFHAPSEAEEAQAVVERILWLKKNKQLRWKDMAILYRSNVLVRNFEVALLQAPWQREGTWVRGIPYQIFGGTQFNERSEIKDLLAYLRAIANPLDQEALLRIINVPRRGISEQTLDLLTQNNRRKGISLWDELKNADTTEQLSKRSKKSVIDFIHLLQAAQKEFASGRLHESLKKFVEKINYKKAIEEEVKSDSVRSFKWENVLNFIDNLKNYEEILSEQNRRDEISLQDFLTSSQLDEQAFSQKGRQDHLDQLQLMTFHSAKGLEFEACFLVGLEDHLIPHEKSLEDTGIEEERRLFYVGITRAKKYLTLSMAQKRKRFGAEESSNPSRFLFEIPKEILKVVPFKFPNA